MQRRLLSAALFGAALACAALVPAGTASVVIPPCNGGQIASSSADRWSSCGSSFTGPASAGSMNSSTASPVVSATTADLGGVVEDPTVVACIPGVITLNQSPTLSALSLVVTAPITSTGGSWSSCGESITGFYYEWLSDGAVISGPTWVASAPGSFTHTISFGDAGHTIRSAVNPCNAEGCYGTYAQSSNGVAVPALPPPPPPPTLVNGAAYVSQSVPTTLVACQTAAASVTMSNSGSTVWGTAGIYRLGSQNPQDNTTWGIGRVELPSSAFPGTSRTFTFAITAPCTPGTYDFQWRMVQDGVQWFGDYTPNVRITVTAPEPTNGDQACTMFPETPGCDLWFLGDDGDMNDCSTITPVSNFNSVVTCDQVSNWDNVTTGRCPHDFPNCTCPTPGNAKRLVIIRHYGKAHVSTPIWFGMRVFWCSSGPSGTGRITRIYVVFDHDVSVVGSVYWHWVGLDSTSCDSDGANHCKEQAGSAVHPVTGITISATGTFQQCLAIRWTFCHDKHLGVWLRIHRDMSREGGNLP